MKIRKYAAIALALTFGLATAAWGQSRSITNNLVVHLSFDNTLNDDSGRGNNAAYVGTNGLSIQPANPTFVSGKLGNAFQFNTYPDASLIEYATLGYPNDLKFGTGTDFSFAFWIKTDAALLPPGGGDPAYIANRDWNSSGSVGWGVFIQQGLTTVRVHLTTVDSSTHKLSVRPNTPANEDLYDNSWHHLAVTCARGGNVKIYVDGVLENTSYYPYSTNTLDTDDITVNGVPEAINVGQDGTGTYTQDPASSNPPAQPGSAGVTNGVIDDLGIWRRALSDIEVANIYNFAQLGTNLFNVPDVHTPILLALTPNNGSVGVLPNIPTTVVIQDQDTKLDPASVQLYVDGGLVTHTLVNVGATNTISYTSPFLFAPLSVHTNQLIFADDSVSHTRTTNTSVYTVAAWTNLYLGQPLYVETFDELAAPTNPPAVYPAGWSVENCTDPAAGAGTWSLFDATSDAYQNWQITPISAIVNNFNYGSRILNVAGPIVANGNVVSVLGNNNIAFAASDQRSGSQVDYLFTSDYNLTGQSNVWVAFNSMYSQENYQMGALEYSIDQGTNWLPVIYMLSSNPTTVVLTNGVVDPDATMNYYAVQIPAGSCGYGNTYGAYVGVPASQYGALGPYIRLGAAGDHITWHRVERFRLPMADGQAKVRFRFAFIGGNFWDWGFDNFGLYTVPAATPLAISSVTASGSSVTVNWNGTGANFAGLQVAKDLTGTNWVDVTGSIGRTNFTMTTSGSSAFYRAKRF